MKHRFLNFKRNNKNLMFPRASATSPSQITDIQLKFLGGEQTHLRLPSYTKINSSLGLKPSKNSSEQTQERTENKGTSTVATHNGDDLFNEMKHRFLSFKKQKYLANLEHYQNLAKFQAPKFLVVACADSRVCPSNILGFEPGDAFVVRNVANLVPPFENGPSETKAALEFSVNTLQVQNILVIGHSRCAGISALMTMPDETDSSSSFTRSWVVVGKNAKLSTLTAVPNLNFDQQCKHCEKESVNHSLTNLLSYPWIEERMSKGVLSIHGGYYDFVNCSFEKWKLDYRSSTSSDDGNKKRYSVRGREIWC